MEIVKLESLENSKFDAFKSNEIMETFRIMGGTPTATTYNSGGNSDCLDRETNDGKHTIDGEGVDYHDGNC